MRMTTSDETLATAARGGDRAAFSLLVERHYDRVFRLAFRMTGRSADAEDLAQDICLSLPQRLGNWEGRGKFTTWLYRVVVNATHDARRKSATRAKAAQGWGDAEVLNRAAAAENKAAADWLTAAMRVLPEDLRDTLALILDDMTHREAAKVLGLSEGTISWRIAEAKKALRALKEADQ